MYTSDLANAARNGFNTLWDQKNSDQARIAIDGIQKGLRCCGSNGPSDWGINIPQSCCDEQTCHLLNAHSKGCGTLLYDFVNDSGLLIAWVAIVFAGIELVGVIFACCRKYFIDSDKKSY